MQFSKINTKSSAGNKILKLYHLQGNEMNTRFF